MQTRAILKAIDELDGGEATATVQLTGLGNLETFHDGYSISHAIPRELLVPGADIVVEIVDPFIPGDGHVVSIASVSSGGAGGTELEQFGNVLVPTDGAGNGAQTVTFPNTFSSFTHTPAVSLAANAGQIGSGTVAASAITTAGFTVTISGAPISSAVAVAWDAQGT